MDFAAGERERDRDLAERTEKAPLRRLSLEDEWPWWPVDLWEMTGAASSKRPILGLVVGWWCIRRRVLRSHVCKAELAVVSSADQLPAHDAGKS